MTTELSVRLAIGLWLMAISLIAMVTQWRMVSDKNDGEYNFRISTVYTLWAIWFVAMAIAVFVFPL